MRIFEMKACEAISYVIGLDSVTRTQLFGYSHTEEVLFHHSGEELIKKIKEYESCQKETTRIYTVRITEVFNGDGITKKEAKDDMNRFLKKFLDDYDDVVVECVQDFTME